MFNFIVWPSVLVIVIHANIAPFVRNEVSSLLKVTTTNAVKLSMMISSAQVILSKINNHFFAVRSIFSLYIRGHSLFRALVPSSSENDIGIEVKFSISYLHYICCRTR